MTHRTCVRSSAVLVALLVSGGLAGVAAAQTDGDGHEPMRAPPSYAEQALRDYFGDAGADDARGPIHERMSAVLAAADGTADTQERARDIGGGRILQTGCRRDGCAEKGAVVYEDGTRSALVAGVLRVACGDAIPPPAGCAPTSTLTLFMSSSSPAPFQALTAIDDWADATAPGATREIRTLP